MMDLFDDLPLPKSNPLLKSASSLLFSPREIENFSKKITVATKWNTQLVLIINSSLKDETTTTAATNTNDKTSTNKRQLESDEKEDNKAAKYDTSTNESSKKLCTNVETPKSVDTRGFFAERKGERDSMQDRHTIIDDFAKCLKKQSSEM